MLFTSVPYLIFFPVVLLLYWAGPLRFRNILLLLGSFVFYGWFLPSYLMVLLFLIGSGYFLALLMDAAAGRKRWVLQGLACTLVLGILIVFKYWDFLGANIQWIFNHLGFSMGWPRFPWLLPLGLSFQVFQTLSYLFEVYGESRPAERKIISYALYIAYFPKLIAGPIERPDSFFSQLQSPRSFDPHQSTEGLRLLLWGFFQKLVIADRLSGLVSPVYAHYSSSSGAALFLATFFYSFQIYADFSSYTDIARGSSKLLGIELAENFNGPYFSSSISEFWNRWHMTLSSWLRDYLFVPLRMLWRSQSLLANCSIVLVVFMICGFWHGASWTFGIFGLIHALGMISQQIFRRVFPAPEEESVAWKAISMVLTFMVVNVAWIFFRSSTVPQALHIIVSIVQWIGSLTHASGWPVLGVGEFPRFDLLVGLLSVTLIIGKDLIKTVRPFESFPVWLRWGLYYAGTVVLLMACQFTGQSFLYFQF